MSVYKSYVSNSPLLEDRRDAFKCISNQYVRGRLETCLKEKAKESKHAAKELHEISAGLIFETSGASNYSEQTTEIERQSSIGVFGEKQSLMENFLCKVKEFEARGNE